MQWAAGGGYRQGVVGREPKPGFRGLQEGCVSRGCRQGTGCYRRRAAGRGQENSVELMDRIAGRVCGPGAAGRMRWASAMGEPLAHLKGAQSFSHPLAPPLGLSCPGRVKAAARTGPEMSPAQHLAKDTLLISPSWSEGQRAGRDLRRSHLLLGPWRTGGC